jgi:hypothetical protein
MNAPSDLDEFEIVRIRGHCVPPLNDVARIASSLAARTDSRLKSCVPTRTTDFAACLLGVVTDSGNATGMI